jgi:hypothetical protein
MGKKRALCVGINAYPNAPLSGCVNDANDWADLLETKGYDTHVLLDHAATRLMVMEHLREMVRQSRFGDRIVFTYSGHGSWVPDMSGDEPDRRDECLCMFDYESGGYILDDELGDIVRQKRFGVRFTIVSDSCHSGSVSRFVDLHRRGLKALTIRPRFVHPDTFLVRPEEVRRIALLRNVVAETTPNKTGAVLFSGCTDEEYSYDAWFGERPNGAFTFWALNVHAAATTDRPPTYRNWHNRIGQVLPSADYPQSPQLFASLWQRTWRL